MAAGAAAAACCSSTTCGACGYLIALSAGLGIASMITGGASDTNRGIASQYRAGIGLMADPYNPAGTTDYTDSGFTDDGSVTDSGLTDGSVDGGLTDGSVDGGLTDGMADGTTTGITGGTTDSTTGITGGTTDSTTGVTDGVTDSSTDGSTDGIRVVDGSTDGSLGGGGITPPGFEYTPSPWEDNVPTVRLPNGDIVRASPKHIGPYLKKKGLKWES